MIQKGFAAQYHNPNKSKPLTSSPKNKCKNQDSTLALFPARMREISNPRLNAWLKSNRDWKVETNGNQDNTAMGVKMSTPIPASYILANSRTESHRPKLLTIFFHVTASCIITKNQKDSEDFRAHKAKRIYSWSQFSTN